MLTVPAFARSSEAVINGKVIPAQAIRPMSLRRESVFQRCIQLRFSSVPFQKTPDRFPMLQTRFLRAAASIALLALMFVLLPSPMSQNAAQAQFIFNNFSSQSYQKQQRYYYKKRKARERKLRRRSASRRAKKRRSKRRYSRYGAAPKTIMPSKTPNGPLTAVVSLNNQSMVIYDNDGVFAQTRVSTGTASHATPTGIFSIIQKRKRHFSNLYANAPMPYMQRITWSGIALHAGVVPRYPASHGCIRMPYNFAKGLFSKTGIGTRIIITRNGAKPAPISHAKLIRPLPPGEADAAPGNRPYADDLENTKPDDRASIDGMNEIIGVTSANAAVAADKPLRTRASVAKERARNVARKEVALLKATEDRQSAADQLKSINAEIKATQIKRTKLKKTVKKKRYAEKKALASGKKTTRKLEKFFRKYSNVRDEETIQKALAEEEALEAELMAFGATAEAARQAMRDTELAIKDAALKIEELKLSRKNAKIDYVAKSKAQNAAKNDLKRAETVLKKQNEPVHILISRKSQKLHVRQGHIDIMEEDVSIAFPDAPIGSHVFTASKYINAETDLSWSVVTAAQVSKNKKSKKKKRIEDDDTVSTRSPAQTAANALERVSISQELRDKLSEYIKPGSSIIISDERKSQETGLGTDLIVLTRS